MLKPTSYDRFVHRLYKASLAADEAKRRQLERQGYRLLSNLYVQAADEFIFDPTITLEQNIQRLNDLWLQAFEGMRPYFNTVALSGSSFGKEQVMQVANRRNSVVTVKSSISFEIEVNWHQADQNVLDWLNNGGNFSSPYFDLVTSVMANTQASWLRREYVRFVNGEQTLEDTQRRLTNLVFSRQRAEMIIRTNTTDIWAQGQQEAYRTSGTSENEWLTRFDEKVCPICRPLHGLRTPIGSEFPGSRVTRPAAHNGCRCFLSPVALTTEELEKKFREQGLLGGNGKDGKKPTVIGGREKEKPVVIRKLIDNVPVDDNSDDEQVITPTVPKFDDLNIIDKLAVVKDRLLVVREEYKNILEPLINEKKSLDEQYTDLFSRISKIKNKKDRLPIINNANEVKEKIKSLDEQIEKYKLERGEKARNVLTENIAPLDIRPESRDGYGTPTDKLKNDFNAFGSLVSEKYLSLTPDGEKGRKFTRVDYIIGNDDRAAYYRGFDEQYIKIKSNVKTKTVVHELGHWLEDRDPEIRRLTKEFIDRRTVGEVEQKMSVLTGDKGYGDDEVTKPDRFRHPYIGKLYNAVVGGGNSASEVLSMGLQYMYQDAVSFLLEDEDHFELTYKIMQKEY